MRLGAGFRFSELDKDEFSLTCLLDLWCICSNVTKLSKIHKTHARAVLRFVVAASGRLNLVHSLKGGSKRSLLTIMRAERINCDPVVGTHFSLGTC